MADSNTATSQLAEQPTFVSKVGSAIHEAYDFISTALLATIYVLIQPYIFFWNLTKSFFEYSRDVIAIGIMSISATKLYLQICIRFLTGLNESEKPAETVINTFVNIGKAINNIYKILHFWLPKVPINSSDEVKSVTFPPVVQDESGQQSGNVGESGTTSNGQPSASGGSPSSDADQNRPPVGNSSGSDGNGSNNSSNGGVDGGTGGDGAAPVSGSGKAKVTFDSTADSNSTAKTSPTKPSSTSSTNQGVDEVDKSGKKTSSTPATSPSSGGAASQTSKV